MMLCVWIDSHHCYMEDRGEANLYCMDVVSLVCRDVSGTVSFEVLGFHVSFRPWLPQIKWDQHSLYVKRVLN